MRQRCRQTQMRGPRWIQGLAQRAHRFIASSRTQHLSTASPASGKSMRRSWSRRPAAESREPAWSCRAQPALRAAPASKSSRASPPPLQAAWRAFSACVRGHGGQPRLHRAPQPVLVEQLFGRAGLGVGVLNSHEFHRRPDAFRPPPAPRALPGRRPPGAPRPPRSRRSPPPRGRWPRGPAAGPCAYRSPAPKCLRPPASSAARIDSATSKPVAISVTSDALHQLDGSADGELLIGANKSREPSERPARMNSGPTYSAAAFTSLSMATSSAGQSTTNPASEQARLRSSMLICEGPSSPMEMPLCVPTTFRFTRGNAAVTRSCSNPLFITNTEKLETNGIFPAEASPAPMATMLASAMPHSTKRSGNSLANPAV